MQLFQEMGISQYLSDKNRSSPSTLAKIAAVLDVTVDWRIMDHELDGKDAADGVTKVTIHEATRLLAKS